MQGRRVPGATNNSNALKTFFLCLAHGFAHKRLTQEGFGTFQAQAFLPQGGHHFQNGLEYGIVVAVGFKGVLPPTLAVVVTCQSGQVVHGVAQHLYHFWIGSFAELQLGQGTGRIAQGKSVRHRQIHCPDRNTLILSIMQSLPLRRKNGKGQKAGLLQLLGIVQEQSCWRLQVFVADPLQGRFTIFGQLDQHHIGLPLLQCAEQTLGGARAVVTDAEDFVHGCVQNLVGKIRNKEKLG